MISRTMEADIISMAEVAAAMETVEEIIDGTTTLMVGVEADPTTTTNMRKTTPRQTSCSTIKVDSLG